MLRVTVLLVPLTVAVIVADAGAETGAVFTVKLWLTLPEGKTRLLAAGLATAGLLLESVTVRSSGPAGPSSVTIPVTAPPPCTGFGARVTEAMPIGGMGVVTPASSEGAEA